MGARASAGTAAPRRTLGGTLGTEQPPPATACETPALPQGLLRALPDDQGSRNSLRPPPLTRCGPWGVGVNSKNFPGPAGSRL